MDEFGLEGEEFSGAFLTLLFTGEGRISRLWAQYPSLEFLDNVQFCCPPFMCGDESTEDYLPGTLLLGARLGAAEPWLFSRNTGAEIEESELETLRIRYTMPFLDELSVIGQYGVVRGRQFQMSWDVTIRNESERTVELGEVGFPFALANMFDPSAPLIEEERELLKERMVLQKFIGGAASYLLATRADGASPALAIFPGDKIGWEFCSSVSSSLSAPNHWGGIPVMYALSRATVEREGWDAWFCGHRSALLEPGREQTFSVRFAVPFHMGSAGLRQALEGSGRPVPWWYPSAVFPVSEGAYLGLQGIVPTRFDTDVPAKLERDADDRGGHCWVKPRDPGPVRLSIEDVEGGKSYAFAVATEPFRDLLVKRAKWICENQLVRDEPLEGAIVPADITESKALTDASIFAEPFGIIGGLADALFLAEKNVWAPVEDQVQALYRYVERFFERVVFLPTARSVGSCLDLTTKRSYRFGLPQAYVSAFCLYDAMARLSESAPKWSSRCAREWRELGLRLIEGMEVHCRLRGRPGQPLIGCAYVAAKGHSSDPSYEAAARLMRGHFQSLAMAGYPMVREDSIGLDALEESWFAAEELNDEVTAAKLSRLLYVHRSVAPAWWTAGTMVPWVPNPTIGSSMRSPGGNDRTLGYRTVACAALKLAQLDREPESGLYGDYTDAFAGLVSVFALVRSDGAAAADFNTDYGGANFGFGLTTGDSGFALYQYLKSAQCALIHDAEGATISLGCVVTIPDGDTGEGEGGIRLQPIDGVGRLMRLRALGLDVAAEGASIVDFRWDGTGPTVRIDVQNLAPFARKAYLSIRGLRGPHWAVARRVKLRQSAGPKDGLQTDTMTADNDGWHRFTVELAANAVERLKLTEYKT